MGTPTESSPASAENDPPAADGATPPPAAAPAATLDPAQAIESGNIDEIRALLRKSNGVLARPTDTWTNLNDEEPAAEAGSETTGEEETPEPSEAEPPAGDEEETPPEETSDDDEQEEEEEPEQPKPDAAKEKGKKDPNRVRLASFPAEDRAIIARMATMDSPSYEAARAELVAEGKLRPAPKPAEAKPPESKTNEPSPIDAQKTLIADLEAKIDEAGTAFDTKALAKLGIEHNKALAALSRLEQKAEAQQAETQAREQTTLQAAVAQAETAAIEMFPDAGKEGTPLYTKIVEMMTKADPAAFTDPDYPLAFAAKAARAIGYKPGAAAQPAPPAPKVVPKKPSRPVPPGPASGSTAPAGAKRQPTLEQRSAEALASNDPAVIRQLLRETGTRSLD